MTSRVVELAMARIAFGRCTSLRRRHGAPAHLRRGEAQRLRTAHFIVACAHSSDTPIRPTCSVFGRRTSLRQGGRDPA